MAKKIATKTVKKSAKPAAKKPAKTSAKTPAKKSVKKSAAKSNVVVVPKPAKGSYNPNRPLSKNTLLLHQVRHFQEVEKALPRNQRTGHDPKQILTEGHAAEYLRKMTAMLHPQARKTGRVLKARGK